jgi:hypothetical protein
MRAMHFALCIVRGFGQGSKVKNFMRSIIEENEVVAIKDFCHPERSEGYCLE